MELLKIRALKELFSFIPTIKQFKIIQNNKCLNNKLNILDFNKKMYFKNKIKNYQFDTIIKYFNQFKKDFGKMIKNEREIIDLFFYELSEKGNFYLKICDNNFNKVIQSIYFKDNLNIEIEYLIKEMIPKILLVKYNRFTKKTIEVFKDSNIRRNFIVCLSCKTNTNL